MHSACTHPRIHLTTGSQQTAHATHTNPPGNWNCDYFDDVAALQGWGARNGESLAELLAAFFYHWAVVHDYRAAVVTVRRGAPLTKAEKGWCVPLPLPAHALDLCCCCPCLALTFPFPAGLQCLRQPPQMSCCCTR